MVKTTFLAVALALMMAGVGESSRILILLPFPGKSHFNSFSNLLDELAKRGHQMTVVSAYPKKTPMANYTDITIDDYLRESQDDDMNMFEKQSISPEAMMLFIAPKVVENCERFFSYPQIQDLIQSKKEFDLLIIEAFFSDCVYGFVHKFKVPFIQISSNSIASWMGDGVGNPNFYSYVPEVMLAYTQEMSFTERLHNTLFNVYVKGLMDWYVIPKMEDIMRKHFDDPALPSILEIRNSASFLLLNSHISVNDPRPLTPNTAEVGGMHIKEPKKLPQDLQKYLDDAPHGVIYFSLGSVIRGAAMPKHIRDAFIGGFSQLKQKVLWKWEESSMPEKPDNVRIENWLPQNEILAHPKVKAFITHGGLLSTQESTYHGKPLIAIPFFADQTLNAKRAQMAGSAIVLDLGNITSDSVQWAVKEVLSNRRYAENAKKRSTILKDQPMKPLDSAVFWVEYVLRHNGAPHMRSAALNLNFFQYYCLDVIAVVLVAILVFLKLSLITMKTLYRRFFGKSKGKQNIGGTKKRN